MNFELGKKYIVEVTDKGIIPIDEFSSEKYSNKDTNPLDFLTDEEKEIIENNIIAHIVDEMKCLNEEGFRNFISKLENAYYRRR